MEEIKSNLLNNVQVEDLDKDKSGNQGRAQIGASIGDGLKSSPKMIKLNFQSQPQGYRPQDAFNKKTSVTVHKVPNVRDYSSGRSSANHSLAEGSNSSYRVSNSAQKSRQKNSSRLTSKLQHVGPKGSLKNSQSNKKSIGDSNGSHRRGISSQHSSFRQKKNTYLQSKTMTANKHNISDADDEGDDKSSPDNSPAYGIQHPKPPTQKQDTHQNSTTSWQEPQLNNPSEEPQANNLNEEPQANNPTEHKELKGDQSEKDDVELADHDSSAEENLQLMLNEADSDDHDVQDLDNMSDADHAQDLDEHLDEDGENSDIFDTDSSDEDPENEPQCLNELPVDLSELQGGIKKDVEDDTEQEKPEEEKQREEMGGVLVYDAYARMKGCEKIEKYFEENMPQKVQTDLLFTKTESKEVSKELFGEQAKARDFSSDQDKNYFRNLPRFLPQRDYVNLHYSLPIPPQQNVLIFDSRFENGNLRKAAKVSNIEYNLWLENDQNTRGHTQWYYFKVTYKDIAVHQDKKVHRIKFNILNLAKTTSLYQQGMKPCVWSKKKQEKDGTGWFRGGENISYVQNQIPRYENESAPPKQIKSQQPSYNLFLLNNNGAGEGVDFYYSFSFTYEFEAGVDDEVWFAHAIPYTFTQMQQSLAELRNEQSHKAYMKMNILCYTLGKSPVPLITITENIHSYLDYYEEMRLMHQIPNIVKKAFRQKYQKAKKLARQGEDSKGRVKRLLEAAFEEEIKCFFEYNEDHFLTTSPLFAGFGQRLSDYLKYHGEKKAIVITSRVHPGEPQASHMLDGLLKYLLSPEAAQLRKHFVIRIVPMLNPDGVIYGNYRCSLLGCDLNRKWEKPNRLLHPTIFHTKQLIRHMHAERKVILYCDLHGHSRKQNAFFYGCAFKNYEQEGRIKNAQLRIIPLLCCQKNSLFSLKDSRFSVEKCKEATGRVVVFREMNIMNSFTLECSFFGKEWKSQTASMQKGMNGLPMDPFSATASLKKKKLTHMSQNDYNSLGSTLIQVMHNYLPSEQSKLQFISGKILDVFYDEFIKFIPPFILKREEEKRKKAEKELLKGNKNAIGQIPHPQRRQRLPNTGANRNISGPNELQIASRRGNQNQTTKKKQDHQKRRQSGRQRNSHSAMDEDRDDLTLNRRNNQEFLLEDNINEYDRHADRTAAAKTKLVNVGIDGEVSSDQKQIPNLSGNNNTDTDHFNSIMNIPSNQNDIMEFEFFMNGIQSKLKEKEEKNKKKLEKLMDQIKGKNKIRLEELLSDSDSSGSSGDGNSPQSRQKKKLKMLKKKKQLEKMIKKADEKNKKKAEETKNQEKNKNQQAKDKSQEGGKAPKAGKSQVTTTTKPKAKSKTQPKELSSMPGAVKAIYHEQQSHETIQNNEKQQDKDETPNSRLGGRTSQAGGHNFTHAIQSSILYQVSKNDNIINTISQGRARQKKDGNKQFEKKELSQNPSYPKLDTGQNSYRSEKSKFRKIKEGNDNELLQPFIEGYQQIGQRKLGPSRSNVASKMKDPLGPTESVSSSNLHCLDPSNLTRKSGRRSSQEVSPSSNNNQMREFIISGSSTHKKQLHYMRLQQLSHHKKKPEKSRGNQSEMKIQDGASVIKRLGAAAESASEQTKDGLVEMNESFMLHNQTQDVEAEKYYKRQVKQTRKQDHGKRIQQEINHQDEPLDPNFGLQEQSLLHRSISSPKKLQPTDKQFALNKNLMVGGYASIDGPSIFSSEKQQPGGDSGSVGDNIEKQQNQEKVRTLNMLGSSHVPRLKSTSHLTGTNMIQNQKNDVRLQQNAWVTQGKFESQEIRPPLHSKQNPMMSGVSITKVQPIQGLQKAQMGSHLHGIQQRKSAADGDLQISAHKRMQKDVLIKGSSGVGPQSRQFQQVLGDAGISGVHIPTPPQGQQKKGIQPGPSQNASQSTIQKTNTLKPGKSPGKKMDYKMSEKGFGNVHNAYQGIINQVRANKIVPSHQNTQQDLMISGHRDQSQDSQNDVPNQANREGSTEPYGVMRPSHLANNPLSKQIEAHQGKTPNRQNQILIGRSAAQNPQHYQLNSAQAQQLSQNRVVIGARQDPGKQNVMKDLMKAIQQEQLSGGKASKRGSRKIEEKPMTYNPRLQQMQLFQKLQGQLGLGPQGFTADSASVPQVFENSKFQANPTIQDQENEAQRAMLIHYISQHYQQSQNPPPASTSAITQNAIRSSAESNQRRVPVQQKGSQQFLSNGPQVLQNIIKDYNFVTEGNLPSKNLIAAHNSFNTRDAFKGPQVGQMSQNISAYQSPEIGRRGARLVPANHKGMLDLSADQEQVFGGSSNKVGSMHRMLRPHNSNQKPKEASFGMSQPMNLFYGQQPEKNLAMARQRKLADTTPPTNQQQELPSPQKKSDIIAAAYVKHNFQDIDKIDNEIQFMSKLPKQPQIPQRNRQGVQLEPQTRLLVPSAEGSSRQEALSKSNKSSSRRNPKAVKK